ncbi:DUF1707 domain-containing protein [Actinoplanes sp. TFC3]|uniref:DUF1707 domain-containing protein n=1 Tax=Actinoplanes sp. TFC3 TaxID=1710355 RepID=UPI000836FDBB|nr:DUF1707 domain-containing protein [Actinoplanes sp. TFC3]
MRAGDADRQAVANKLRAALDEGRLDLHEYDDRVQQAYAAKTYGELNPLLQDLPTAKVSVPVESHATGRWLREVWGSWLGVVGVTCVIWLISSVASGDLTYFWPVWVAVPWGLVLVFVTVTGLSTGEPRKQAEKRARKQLKRERRALTRDDEKNQG